MDLTPVVRFALLLVRPGLVVMLAPGIGGGQFPPMIKIGLTVFLALIGVVAWGSLAGSMLPFLLRRLGFDPATSSAPAGIENSMLAESS